MSEFSLPPFLVEECSRITPLAPEAIAKAQAHLDSLAKPLGSLGRLEDAACRLYAAQGSAPAARPARMFTIAGDHGVVDEGIAFTPKEVTVLMVENFLQGGAAINALCLSAGVELLVVDAGVAGPAFAPHPMMINARIAEGTANIATGPAMTEEQCAKALQLGIDLAEQAKKDGVVVLGTGEMGIGNTTPSSALFCAYFGFSPEEMTGMGAGVPAKGLAHKTAVIGKALEANSAATAGGNPFKILAALGGLEIAALAGLIIGGAARRQAVVIDGFIATAAYAAASRMAPAVRDYCFFSHGSAEAGHGRVLAHLGEKPLLDLGMRLGEGTGAAVAMQLLKAAVDAYNNMATLDSLGIRLP